MRSLRSKAAKAIVRKLTARIVEWFMHMQDRVVQLRIPQFLNSKLLMISDQNCY